MAGIARFAFFVRKGQGTWHIEVTFRRRRLTLMCVLGLMVRNTVMNAISSLNARSSKDD